MKLKKEEKEFLEKHGIPVNKLFDAKGMKPKEYKPIMEDLEKHFAINTTPCKREGHTIRTKRGKCIMCNPLALVYIARHHAKGYVYIAGTISGQKIKVGFSQDILERAKSLNRTKYGGYNDWVVLYYIGVNNAGEVENKIGKKLEKYFFQTDYEKEGKKVATFELFRCSYEIAKKNADSVEKDVYEKAVELSEDILKKYNFKNILNNSNERISYSNINNIKDKKDSNDSEVKKIIDFDFEQKETVKEIKAGFILVDDSEQCIKKNNENFQNQTRKEVDFILVDNSKFVKNNKKENTNFLEKKKQIIDDDKKNSKVRNKLIFLTKKNKKVLNFLLWLIMIWLIFGGWVVIFRLFVPPKTQIEKNNYYRWQIEHGECQNENWSDKEKSDCRFYYSLKIK